MELFMISKVAFGVFHLPVHEADDRSSDCGSRDTSHAEMKRGLAMTAAPFLSGMLSKARHRPR